MSSSEIQGESTRLSRGRSELQTDRSSILEISMPSVELKDQRAPTLSSNSLFADVIKKAASELNISTELKENFSTILEDKTIAVNGLGGIGVFVALALKEAGADVTVYHDSKKPVAMQSALGIIEHQGSDLDLYYRNSLPFFDYLTNSESPVRMNTVRYLYSNEETFAQDIGLYNGMKSVEGANVNKFVPVQEDYDIGMEFQGYIFKGSDYRDYVIGLLEANNVNIVDETITTLEPRANFDFTVSCLGMGRKEFDNAKKKDNKLESQPDSNLLGTYGQILHLKMELPELQGGTMGFPLKTGSMNLVQHYVEVDGEMVPTLYIGATKIVGEDRWIPDSDIASHDYEWLLSEAIDFCPYFTELYKQHIRDNIDDFTGKEEELLLDETVQSSSRLKEHVKIFLEDNVLSYSAGCVRPTVTEGSSYKIDETKNHIDVYGLGGAGNSVAPGIALEVLDMIRKTFKEDDHLVS